MVYTEVTEQGWFSRLRGSIKGIFVAFLFLAGGIYLLFWGEGRAVRRAKALAEGATSVMSVSAAGPQSSDQDKLVHVSGELSAPGILEDRLLGVRVSDAVRLQRRVEMYQWREDVRSETKNKLGGGTETVKTYDYEKVWSSSPIDSRSFKVRDGHENPPMRFEDESWVAETVHLGGWELGETFVSKLSKRVPVDVGSAELEGAPSSMKWSLHLFDNGFFHGDDPAAPAIGDLKIQWEVVETATVSIVGRQSGKSLESYTTRNGGTIALLSYGTVAADAMFESAKAGNASLTWILRVVGLIVLFLGWRMLLTPLRIVADVVPMAGRIVGTGIGVVSFVLALISTLATVAVGWFFYRPMIGVVLLVICGVALVWIIRKVGRSTAPAPMAPPTPPPTPPTPPPSSVSL